MNSQIRLLIFGVVFLLFGVVFLVRGFLASGKSVRAVFFVSGIIVILAGCLELYLAMTFVERRSVAIAERVEYDRISKEQDRALMEKAENEIQTRVPVLQDRKNKAVAGRDLSERTRMKVDEVFARIPDDLEKHEYVVMRVHDDCDAWGRSLMVRAKNNNAWYEVRSSGLDGEFYTEDDIARASGPEPD